MAAPTRILSLSLGTQTVGLAEFKTGPQNPDFRHALAQAVDYGADLWGMTPDEFDATVATGATTGGSGSGFTGGGGGGGSG